MTTKTPCPRCQSLDTFKYSKNGSRTYYRCKSCECNFREKDGLLSVTREQVKKSVGFRQSEAPKFRCRQIDILRAHGDKYRQFREDHGKEAADNYLAVLGGYPSAKAAIKQGGWVFSQVSEQAESA